MVKRVIVLLLLLIFSGGIIVFLYMFEEEKKLPLSIALSAIPSSSAFIIETNHTHDSWKKLSETNIIWQELLNVNLFAELDNQITFFDSIYILNPAVKEILDKQCLYISAHKNSENTFNFLFLINIPPNIGSTAILNLLSNLSNGMTIKTKEYDGSIIREFYPDSLENVSSPGTNPNKKGYGPVFSFSIYKDIFIGSKNSMLVEDAVRQVNSGVSLQNDFAFSKVLATSGEMAEVHFYLNHNYFPGIISLMTKADYSNSLLKLKNFADWTAMDLKLKPNTILLNGFTFSNDSLRRFLNLFKDQKPQEARLMEIFPSGTSSFIHFGFSNFSAFYKAFNSFADSPEREEKIISIEKDCKCNIQKTMVSWVENEMAIVASQQEKKNTELIFESQEERQQPINYFGLFRSHNIEEAEKLLYNVSDSIMTMLVDSTSPQLEVHRLKYQGVFPLLLGNLFLPVQAGYFFLLDDYAIFANDVQSLQDFSAHYFSEKTLSKKLNFISLAENLSSESNILLYSNIEQSENLIKNFLTVSYEKQAEKNKGIFEKFDGFAIQLSTDNNNLFYTNVFLNYNPVTKKENSTIWETRLDTTVSTQPTLVTNHYTMGKEIVVQDEGNEIYLISGTGKILWKKILSEKIISGITQVDALKNNKLQMVFNTESYIYIIDRNGKDLPGFPVKLKAPATNSIAVFDYDKNKNYRMLISCNDLRVYNYEISGLPVKGWEFEKLKNQMKTPFHYLSLDGKDYLIGIDAGGNIYISERNGKKRIDLKTKMFISKNNDFFVDPGKNINKTRLVATDLSGNIIRLYMNGNIENIKIDDFTENHFFSFRDITGDQSAEYIFADNNKLSVYSQEKLRYPFFDQTFESKLLHSPLFFEFRENKKKTGISVNEPDQLFLFDENGKIEEGFPLYGTTPFCIGEINNDGVKYLITGTGKNIYAYLLK